MILQAERELLVEYGKRMSREKLTAGTGGNLSIYNAEQGLMAITPSGMDYFEISPEDIVVMDLENHIVDSNNGHYIPYFIKISRRFELLFIHIQSILRYLQF